ncbi:uncharacterized protein C9orf85 homolog [Sycon ciliatum]|uniref:uncharacterized protein C9orf85 homolog n=1 Tax=Sycon ciliatum TaxID=27933 RepID=UPI0031F684F4
MSSRKGNSSKKGQKHSNAHAYKVSPYDKARRRAVEGIATDATCPRCHEKLEWKKKYDKYKPLTVLKKCVQCQNKCIKEAYRIMCRPCADAKGLCTKCGKPIPAEDESDAAASGGTAPPAAASTSASASAAADSDDEDGCNDDEDDEDEDAGDEPT